MPPFGEKTREKERNGWPLERRKQIDLSLVVPCFNEGGNVRRFQEEVREVFAGSGLTYELVFVDDGSRDDTLAQLRQLFQEGACPIQIVRFSRNFGKEAAMLAGLQAARGEQPVSRLLAPVISSLSSTRTCSSPQPPCWIWSGFSGRSPSTTAWPPIRTSGRKESSRGD